MSDEEKKQFYIWIIGVLLGSVGLNQGINKITPEVRYDSWTSTQDHHAMSQLERRVDEIYAIQKNIQYRMKLREDDGRECKAMITSHISKAH